LTVFKTELTSLARSLIPLVIALKAEFDPDDDPPDDDPPEGD